MSSPISNYEEIYLDLKNQLSQIDTVKKDGLKVIKQNFFKFHKRLEYISNKNLVIGYVVIVISILLLLKPGIIYKKFKNKDKEIVKKFSIQNFLYYTFIFCIPIAIYIIMRSKI